MVFFFPFVRNLCKELALFSQKETIKNKWTIWKQLTARNKSLYNKENIFRFTKGDCL